MVLSKDLKLHEKIYESKLQDDPNNIFKPRVKIFNLFEKKIKKISGKILDIGAGTGYASIWLALYNNYIEQVVAVESSRIAAEKLIPKFSKYFKTEKKIKTILNDFTKLDYNNEFDFIISFGSIHHSECLLKTMKSLNNYLKNEGYLIMIEPSMSDFTSNKEYISKYKTKEIFGGEEIFNFERNDKFFRICEYTTAAYYSSFDLKFKDKFMPKKTIIQHLKSLFKYNKKKLVNQPIPMIYFFQKNKNEYIPHKWKEII